MTRTSISEARQMRDHELREHGTAVALRQLELRERGSATVRGVLRTVGQLSYGADWSGYAGTAGWHITAYVAPDNRIGFVNTAHGIAVRTDVVLDAAAIEALTVPEQGEGVKASGAAAWTSPDVGTAQVVEDQDGVMRLRPPPADRGPEAPRGWVQLVLDLRGTAEPVPCRAHVCAWGLRTCYEGRRGAPGAQFLDAFDGQSSSNPYRHLNVRDWPITSEQRDRMRRAATPILERMTRQLAERAAVPEVAAALDAGSVIQACSATLGPWRSHGYTAAGAVTSSVSIITDEPKEALRHAGITWLCALAGDLEGMGGGRYYDVLHHLLVLILHRDLTPVAEALWSSLEQYVQPSQPEGWIGPMVTSLAPKAAELILAAVVDRDALSNRDEAAIVDALYLDGYVEVAVPIYAASAHAATREIERNTPPSPRPSERRPKRAAPRRARGGPA